MANYILRRDGRDYQAPDLETMRQWAQDGRVLPTDMVFSPRYQSWYRARDLRELRDVLPQAETAASMPPPVARPPQQFWVRKGDRNYVADSLQTILEWAANGNISPDDLIYHPTYGKWFRAGDSPQLASRFPAHLAGARLPFIPPGDDPLGSGEFGAASLDPNRNRPQSSPLSNGARRRSVMPQRSSRTGPVLIGNRRGPASGPFLAGPQGQQPVEAADSTTRTVTDFSAGDVARALQARQSGAVDFARTEQNPAVRDMSRTEQNPVVRADDPPEDERPKPTIGDWSREDDAVFSAPLQQRTEPPAERVAPRSAPAPAGVPQPAPQPETTQQDASSAGPVGNEPALDPIYDDIGTYDDEARLTDRLKLFKPFYDVARVFLVTKDMRPGETLETEARIPGENFKGWEKRAIYMAMRRYLVEHLNTKVKSARELVTAEERPGYEHLVGAAVYLVHVLDGAFEIIGRLPPERFVIGNSGRSKMHPTEEALMLDIDHALKALISVKSKAAA
ncbi:MAG: hypothetical protein R3F65_17140 [bacterium]